MFNVQLKQGAHDITTLANEASGVMGCGQRRLTVYLLLCGVAKLPLPFPVKG